MAPRELTFKQYHIGDTYCGILFSPQHQPRYIHALLAFYRNRYVQCDERGSCAILQHIRRDLEPA
jgi:hypothetical protein